jgi:flagella basal body P-ring formation protein FlgA
MFKYFLIFLLITNIYCNEFFVKDSYTISSKIVYSTDLFPNIEKKFEIAKIPDYSFEYKIPTTKLKSIFKSNGIEIQTPDKFYIKFVASMNYDEELIKKRIYEEFTENYDDLEINSITISPNTKTNLNGYQISSINFDKYMTNNARGTLGVTFTNGSSQNKNVYFTFEIEAKQKILIATDNIEKDEILSKGNIALTLVPFIKRQTSTKEDILSDRYICASQNIKKGSVITDRVIKKVDIIKRGSSVNAVYSKGAIDIEFSATALQNGTFDEIILIQRDDKKYKAKVIDSGFVVIE